MQTYELTKVGCSFFYDKRIVLEDGISTTVSLLRYRNDGSTAQETKLHLKARELNPKITLKKAFIKACKQTVLTTNSGVEFLNNQVQASFKQQKIENFENKPGDHAKMGMIERLHGTMKQRQSAS
ncbi:Chromodomain containing hypothetical protein [Phytophthora palmivora]|uniref:Uncharacterized protein n=1 Tax=Phytophthora palmivora TaxID=4796 RepID=A0A2P4Y795_9STRA|nr:Chromodomain containing hypothetical protein [Phytophthora palmivora]